MRALFVSVALVLSAAMSAQPLTLGTYTPGPLGTASISSTAAQSFVNLGDVAARAGTIRRASVYWTGTCANAFKIVVLRSAYQTASSFTVVATRGPFNAVQGINVVDLEPPIAVNGGDAIGVVQLLPLPTCGSVGIEVSSAPSGFLLLTTGDISTTGTLGPSTAYASQNIPSFLAYETDPVLVRIVPVVGSVTGANDSFFRTSLQLFNPDGNAAINGKLVFHRQGQPAADSDPSLAFTLGPRQALSYADIIASLGASGLGSLDVYTNGGAAPVVTARVFDDRGSAGTSGLSQEGVPVTAALDFFNQSLIPIPSDLTNYRMNIGVRTLTTTTLTVRTYNAAGALVRTRTDIVYGANVFLQGSAAELAGFVPPATLPPGGYLRVSVTSFPGRAIVYSSVIDNRTNDSTYRLANAVVR